MRQSVESGLARGFKRPVAVEWPALGVPQLATARKCRPMRAGAVANLLLQAGARLENLSLQAQRAVAERREVELREAAARAELQALHAQVQPHFLFNALNALSYLTETDPPAAQRFTERLADMLRYTIEAGRRPAALLSEEIAFVEDYLGVAGERYDSDLNFEYRGPRGVAVDRGAAAAAAAAGREQPQARLRRRGGRAAPGAQARVENGFVRRCEFADDGRHNGAQRPRAGRGTAESRTTGAPLWRSRRDHAGRGTIRMADSRSRCDGAPRRLERHDGDTARRDANCGR